MSDTLAVGGGGTLTVASEELLVAADRALLLAAVADGIAAGLRAAASEGALLWLADQVDELADRLRVTSRLLHLALDAYSGAELAVTGLAEAVTGQLAYWAGVLAPFAAAFVPLPLVLGVAAWLGIGAPGATELLGMTRPLLSDPRLVGALRFASAAVDDGMRGAARLPWLAALVADDRLTGVLGREAAARALLGALPGPPPSGPLLLEPGPAREVVAPVSLEELASRIPAPTDGGPQLTVERYDGEDGPVFAVYVGGTVDFSPEAGDEPWDLASNVAAMGGAPAHSVAAAASALRESGASPSDQVVLVGYSQGGLVASRLAESGQFDVAGMVTVGSPGGAIPPPEGIPVLAIEHTEDLVPALAGPVAAGARVVVTRSLYDGRPPESPRAVPAHELSEYRGTLALADRSEERRVQQVRQDILGLFPQSAGTSAQWRAERAR